MDVLGDMARDLSKDPREKLDRSVLFLVGFAVVVLSVSLAAALLDGEPLRCGTSLCSTFFMAGKASSPDENALGAPWHCQDKVLRKREREGRLGRNASDGPKPSSVTSSDDL